MLKYSGKGSHLPGIPARDLSDDEVRKFGGEQKLISTGLYIKPKTIEGVNKASRSKEKWQE